MQSSALPLPQQPALLTHQLLTGLPGSGLEARDEIEDSTNRLAERAFAAISDDTWPNWLQALEGLPGDAGLGEESSRRDYCGRLHPKDGPAQAKTGR